MAGIIVLSTLWSSAAALAFLYIFRRVLDDGVTYADFQSAQAVQRYVTKARNALRGLSLS